MVAPAVIMLVYSFAPARHARRRGARLHARELRRRPRPGLPADRDPLDPATPRITTVLCLAAGYPVAYLIGRADERWRNLLLMVVMVPVLDELPDPHLRVGDDPEERGPAELAR